MTGRDWEEESSWQACIDSYLHNEQYAIRTWPHTMQSSKVACEVAAATQLSYINLEFLPQSHNSNLSTLQNLIKMRSLRMR